VPPTYPSQTQLNSNPHAGDFFPAGRDLALLGIGLRSNLDACKQLMEQDLLGTRRFAVVRDDFEQHQVGAGMCVCLMACDQFGQQVASWWCGTTLSSTR